MSAPFGGKKVKYGTVLRYGPEDLLIVMFIEAMPERAQFRGLSLVTPTPQPHFIGVFDVTDTVQWEVVG